MRKCFRYEQSFTLLWLFYIKWFIISNSNRLHSTAQHNTAADTSTAQLQWDRQMDMQRQDSIKAHEHQEVQQPQQQRQCMRFYFNVISVSYAAATHALATYVASPNSVQTIFFLLLFSIYSNCLVLFIGNAISYIFHYIYKYIYLY